MDHGVWSRGLAKVFDKHVCHAVHDFFLLSSRQTFSGTLMLAKGM
jgi:hypothetical protein